MVYDMKKFILMYLIPIFPIFSIYSDYKFYDYESEADQSEFNLFLRLKARESYFIIKITDDENEKIFHEGKFKAFHEIIEYLED